MCIFPQLRKSGNVQQLNRLSAGTYYVFHHECRRWQPGWVYRSSHRNLLLRAVLHFRLIPIRPAKLIKSLKQSVHIWLVVLLKLDWKEKNLLVVRGWNSLKEDAGFRRVYIWVHPLRPCHQCFAKCNHPIHVFVCLITFLNVIPSACDQRRGGLFMHLSTSEDNTTSVQNTTYCCFSPLRYHHCQVLKISTSMSFHKAPFLSESNFITLPMVSTSMSTRYREWNSITDTP